MDENNLEVIFVCPAGYNSNVAIVVSNCDLPKWWSQQRDKLKKYPTRQKRAHATRQVKCSTGRQKITPSEVNSSLSLSIIEHKDFIYTLHFRCLEMIKVISQIDISEIHAHVGIKWKIHET